MGYPHTECWSRTNRGNYSFLKGIAPYSAGAVAEAGFEVVHVRLQRYIPLRAGFDSVEAHLKEAGRPLQAMCGMELQTDGCDVPCKFRLQRHRSSARRVPQSPWPCLFFAFSSPIIVQCQMSDPASSHSPIPKASSIPSVFPPRVCTRPRSKLWPHSGAALCGDDFWSSNAVEIRVKAPEEEHTVTVGKVLSWLDGGARSPNEQVKKNRLKERLRR